MWASHPCLMLCSKSRGPLSLTLPAPRVMSWRNQRRSKASPFHWSTPPGILEPRDLIEEEAVKRSHLYIKSADLVLLILDSSRPLEEQDMLLFEQLKNARVLVVVNKADLGEMIDKAVPEQIFGRENMIRTSVLQAASMEALETKDLLRLVSKDKNLDTHGIMISNIRHIKSLEIAQENLQGPAA